ncbi:hypothetical protein ABBQ38_014908 [Trebouxia sp. C0009 RCD-2024]
MAANIHDVGTLSTGPDSHPNIHDAVNPHFESMLVWTAKQNFRRLHSLWGVFQSSESTAACQYSRWTPATTFKPTWQNTHCWVQPTASIKYLKQQSKTVCYLVSSTSRPTKHGI